MKRERAETVSVSTKVWLGRWSWYVAESRAYDASWELRSRTPSDAYCGGLSSGGA